MPDPSLASSAISAIPAGPPVPSRDTTASGESPGSIPAQDLLDQSNRVSGLTALGAAATAVLGVVTAIYPHVPVLAAITDAIPQLQMAIPVILTAVGSIVAAVSHPPAFLRRL